LSGAVKKLKKYFRKIELYQLDLPDNVNLEHMNVFAAPFGGPIAITKDPKKVAKANSSNKPVIQIFTSSGRLISTIHVSNHNKAE
jgi:vacuolar protein sorting-associated protein 16